MANLLNSPIVLVRRPAMHVMYKGPLKLMKVFSWLPVIDETVVLACQIFNLERSYRINGNRILVLVIITPFM
jgi:hypothetical protein